MMIMVQYQAHRIAGFGQNPVVVKLAVEHDFLAPDFYLLNKIFVESSLADVGVPVASVGVLIAGVGVLANTIIAGVGVLANTICRIYLLKQRLFRLNTRTKLQTFPSQKPAH